jgi:predicted Zn-dependent peptidase
MRALIGGAAAVLVAACPGPRTTTDPRPLDRPRPPAATTTTATAVTDPATVVDGDVTDGWVNGIHVLVKRAPGAETAATRLYILGGARNWGAADAGIESLALQTAVTGGTERQDKDAFAARLDELGSTIETGTNESFSVLEAWCLTPVWDETFAMLADTFRRPALPTTQLEVARSQQLAALQHEQDDPDSRLTALVMAGIWKGHPYANRASGTASSLADLTPDAVAAHLRKLRETSRLLLVVVGDLDADAVFAAVAKGLGDLPRGTYVDAPLPNFTADRGEVTIVADELPTTYIEAVVPGPTWRDPDYYVAWAAMATLNARVLEEVRTKRSLSYAPQADFDSGMLPFALLYVTAVDPKSTMEVMLGEVTRLGDDGVPADELARTKATMLTDFYIGQQTLMGQARTLEDAELFAGDWHRARTMIDEVDAVTADQVKAWAKAHLTHWNTFVIGDPTKIDKAALEAF